MASVILTVLCAPTWCAQGEGIGSLGGGIFRPSGSDADVAHTSPAIQFTAAIGTQRHLGFEAELLYVPIQLKDEALPGSAYSKSSQISLVAGLRFSSDRLLSSTGLPIGYLSMRGGIARIATKSNTQLYDGEWIGRTVDELVDPQFANFETKSIHKGFVLSPKAGLLIRISDRTAIDVCAYPQFIFAVGNVTRQFFVTASFALAALQDL